MRKCVMRWPCVMRKCVMDEVTSCLVSDLGPRVM